MIERELELISALRYEHYFLTVQDIVQFARSQGILCQGRGSAANSAVCYCLHITEVDPARMHLLFERFVSKERDEPPDIDVDFEHERREEVIQYIYKRYGRDRAALAATLITYRPKSAVRDVGKALGMDLGPGGSAGQVTGLVGQARRAERPPRESGPRSRKPGGRAVPVLWSTRFSAFPRHLSQHVGGFVISRGPLAQLVPVENAAMVDRTVIQWDKDDLEALGLLKVDVLALGMLTAIRKALDGHERLPGHARRLTVARIPAEDPETYRMLQQGDSVGVFQVESRAQMAMLPRLKPQQFYDLVIEVAIVRPGPIQGDMVHPYLRRRQGIETSPTPTTSAQGAGAHLGGADFSGAGDRAGHGGRRFQRRRSRPAAPGHGRLETARRSRTLRTEAHRRHAGPRPRPVVCRAGVQADPGFWRIRLSRSPCASFALLVYVSAWLKCHEPAAFYCGLLNSLPMGFYSPSQIVQDAKRHGIEVLPIDVQCSSWDHRQEPETAEPGASSPASSMRLGLRMIKGLNEETGSRIAAAQPFHSSEDLARRAELNARELKFLARAGALKNLSGHRYQAHWDVSAIRPDCRWKVSAR